MLKNKRLYILLSLVFAISFIYFYTNSTKDKANKKEEATILLEKIQEVEKLHLVEGYFAEVYTYKQAKNLFFGLLPVEKKIVVIVKAKASVGYDLRKLDYEIDKEHKQIIIKHIPEEEVIIEPDITYYDIQDSQWYKLNADDYTEVNKKAVDLIREQVDASSLPMTAKQRLQVVLEQIIFKGETMNWDVIIDYQ